jgi:hypothetical protein
VADEVALDPNVDWAFVSKMIERYPGYTWVGAVPEVRDLIVRATKEEWAPELFEAQLRNTGWWKSTNDSQRQWVAIEQTNPGEAANRVNATKRQIATLAGSLGRELTDDQLGGIAWEFHRQGWDEQQLRQVIAQHTGGSSTAAQVDVRALANAYMVDVSDTQVDEWTRRMFDGSLDETRLRDTLGQLATAKFPYLATQMAGGVLPGDYFAAYRSMIAQLTDSSEEQVDMLRDPTWRAITSHADPSGQIRAMTLNEAEHYIRGTSAFRGSRTGQQQLAGFEVGLQELLGVR